MIKFVIISFIAVVVWGRNNSSETRENKANLDVVQTKLLMEGLYCVQEHHLTLAEIKQFKRLILPDGENVNCFAACMLKRLGVIDDMGKFNATGARALVNLVYKNNTKYSEMTEMLIHECSPVNEAPTTDGNEGCDRAKLLYDCVSKSSVKNDFHLNF